MPHRSHHTRARCASAVATLGVTLGLAVGASAAQAALPPAPIAAPTAPVAGSSPIQAAVFGSGATGLATPGATEIAQRARARCDRLQRRLKRQRDDGTLNAQDFRRLRRSGC